LGYRKYPCHTCISVNDEVVHGLSGDRELRFGDIVSVDVGVVYKGFVGDTARTVAVGGCGVLAQRLMDVTERALYEGITAALPGNRVTDISRAVQNYVEGNGFSVVREFVGHGVGRTMHEEPQVPNFVDRKMNDKLRAGMTIAIEPMVNAGQAAVKILNEVGVFRQAVRCKSIPAVPGGDELWRPYARKRGAGNHRPGPGQRF